MTAIIPEHIHHDIYLLNLKNKFKIYLFTKEIIVNNEFEKNLYCLKILNNKKYMLER